jgi:hypothetical protein
VLSRLAASLVAAVVVIVSCVCASVTAAVAGGGTSIVVLVDFSESYSPLQPADQSALKRIAEAIADLTKSDDVPKPVVVLFFGIGNTSMISASPCGVPLEYQPKLTGRARPGVVTRLAELQIRLDECVQVVIRRSRKPDKYTDISGAVAAAAESSRTGFVRRIVFIVSDFYEDRPPGAAEVQYRLAEEQFALVYRPESRDAQNQNQVLQRLEEWERRLRDRGAGSVCRLFSPSVSKNSLLNCLQDRRN